MGTHFHPPTRPKARKSHKCIACWTAIVPGETYVTQSGHYEDRAFRNKFHVECWDTLCEAGDFEFEPGELEPPPRTHTPPNTEAKPTREAGSA